MTARPAGKAPGAFAGSGISMLLPHLSPNLLAGFLEAVAGEPYRGHADLPALAGTLQMEIDDLFPIAETLQLLRFAELVEGDIKLTEAGRRFVDLDPDDRKRLFAAASPGLCAARRPHQTGARRARRASCSGQPLPR
jgi:NitT/TauT family transport system ATP-binding protein